MGTIRARLVLFFRHKLMTGADLLKWAIAALVAYLTAMGTIQARIAVIETNRTNDRQMIEKIDRNVDLIREKVSAIDATVQRLEEKPARR